MDYFGENFCSNVFLIGAYHGYKKPDSVDDFQNQFIEESKTLGKEGFIYNEKRIRVLLHLIICDSPARSMITGTKSHNGHCGCPRCIDEG